MIWPFHRSKPRLQDVVLAEKARKEREIANAKRTEDLQKALQDALTELGPQHKATNRD